MAGLMSFIDTLASSPVGKVAGGYMEGEIDKWKEEARLKEKKDDRYGKIEDSITTNLATIEAGTIAQATTEQTIYDQALRWANSHFGEGGLFVVEKMKLSGAFDGARTLQDVLTFSNNLYGANLPEGSEPWFRQPEIIDWADENKGLVKAPSSYYQDIISQSKGKLGGILSEAGIGDNTFNLFTSGEPQTPKAVYDKDAGRIVAADQTAPTTTEEEFTEPPKLPPFPNLGQIGISGFSDTAYAKRLDSVINTLPQYANIEGMFLLDGMGGMTINKAAFGTDLAKMESAGKLQTFADTTYGNASAEYSMGIIKDGQYKDLEKFFNIKDFNEIGFVNKVVNDYVSVTNLQKAEIVKLNILRQEFSDAITAGILDDNDIAMLSDRLDDGFPYSPGDNLSWENQYLRTVGIKDNKHPFRQAYNEIVNSYIKGYKPAGKYSHKMLFIDPDKQLKDMKEAKNYLAGLPEEKRKTEREKNNLQFFIDNLTTQVEHDEGTEPIQNKLNRIAPENYADIRTINNQLKPIEEEFEIIVPEEGPIDTVKAANFTEIAKNKLGVTEKPIEGVPEVAGSILKRPEIQTKADILAFFERNRNNPDAMRSEIIGYIALDIKAGNIPNMYSSDIVDLADQVMIDISDIISPEGGTDATNTAEAEQIVDQLKIDDTTKKSIIETDESEVLLDALTAGGDEPWLFPDGTFNPDFDESQLEGNSWDRDSELGRYSEALKAHRASKFWKGGKNIVNWLKENALIKEGETWKDK
jgi:hypothetical protein